MTGPPEGTEEEPTGSRSMPKGFSVPAPGAPTGPPEQKHSAVVGFMSVPVHPRLPIRRSTLLMVVAFVGLGTLLYFYPPQSTATGAVVHTPNGDYFVPGATQVNSSTTTTTTVPPTTTTTTTGPVTTTTSGPVTTTTVPRTVPTSTSTSPSTSTTSTTAASAASSTTTSTTPRTQGTGTSSTVTRP
jgi:hypothetical protein